jgi:hypothetical protein
MLLPVLLLFVTFNESDLNTLIEEKKDEVPDDEAHPPQKSKNENNIKKSLLLLWHSKVKSLLIIK